MGAVSNESNSTHLFFSIVRNVILEQWYIYIYTYIYHCFMMNIDEYSKCSRFYSYKMQFHPLSKYVPGTFTVTIDKTASYFVDLPVWVPAAYVHYMGGDQIWFCDFNEGWCFCWSLVMVSTNWRISLNFSLDSSYICWCSAWWGSFWVPPVLIFTGAIGLIFMTVSSNSS